MSTVRRETPTKLIPVIDQSLQRLQRYQPFHLLMKLVDTSLLGTVVLLALSSYKIFAFHLAFFLLTFGAFYWQFSAFVLRVAIVVTATSGLLVGFVLADVIPVVELIEIPMLSAILFIVFIIAGQRAKAEVALQQANDLLENRVLARTVELRQEIAERLQAEAILRESEDRYRRLVELSFDAIVIHRGETLLYVNPAGVQLFGATAAQEIVGTSLVRYIHPDFLPAVQARLDGSGSEIKRTPLAEEQWRRVDGSTLDVEVITIPIVYKTEPAMQTVIRDISVRREAEDARAAERLAIARDLHDSLAQNLAFLRLKLDELTLSHAVTLPTVPPTTSVTPCATTDAGDAHAPEHALGFAQLRDIADEAYHQVRTTIATLMPANSAPFVNSLRAHATTLAQQGAFQVQVVNRGEEVVLPPLLQQHLLLICRELLTNVVKHAQAQQVAIEITWTPKHVTIGIADDGIGFEPTNTPATHSFGLRIVQERTAQINGTLDIQSESDCGTTVTIQTPLPL